MDERAELRSARYVSLSLNSDMTCGEANVEKGHIRTKFVAAKGPPVSPSSGANEKSSKVAKCFEPRLPWELEIANSLVTK